MTTALTDLKNSRWLLRILPVFILGVLMVLFQVTTNGSFFNLANLKRILDQTLVVATVSTGAVFIFSGGSINLAMGATTALASTICMTVYLMTSSIPALFATAIVIGVLIMAFSGAISSVLHVPVLFVTVAMMGLLSAMNTFILNGATLALPYAVQVDLRDSNFSYYAFSGYFLIAAVLFHFTSIGRSLKFLGANKRCARLTGLNQVKFEILGFLIAGFGVGFAVIMNLIRSGSVSSTTLSSLNMDVMLAIVLGGMPVFGGSKSRIYAGVIGAVTVAVLNNGMLMSGVPNGLITGVRGLIFLILVIASHKRSEGLPSRQG